MNTYATQIIRILERVTASVIFEDWLDLVHASLEALPRHLESAVRERTLAPETDEAEKMFERLRSRYQSKYYWELFYEAFAILLDSADDVDGSVIWDDTIGQIYMEWGVPNKHTGQFFTPFEVARMMARVSMDDIQERVFGMLETAYLQTPVGQMHEMLTSRERVNAFVRQLGPDMLVACAEYVKPIRISDPACGSGVMFLACAEQTPRWMLDWGLVQFYGQDIDMTCVRMCQVNMMLYGLNGYNLRNAAQLAQAEAPEGEPEPIIVDVSAWRQEALL